MIIAASLKAIVAKPSVSGHHAPRFDAFFHKCLEGVGGGIRNTTHANAAESAATHLLDRHNDQQLVKYPATTDPFLGSPPLGLVDLDSTLKPVKPRPHHRPAQLVQPCPRCLVALQSQNLLQPKGAATGLLARYLTSTAFFSTTVCRVI
jgi:hypothetical protein